MSGPGDLLENWIRLEGIFALRDVGKLTGWSFTNDHPGFNSGLHVPRFK
jgi:hypothetical protein